jgi:hypothetical protein
LDYGVKIALSKQISKELLYPIKLIFILLCADWSAWEFQKVTHRPAFSILNPTTELYPLPHPTPGIESSISGPLTPYLCICAGNGLVFIKVWNMVFTVKVGLARKITEWV